MRCDYLFYMLTYIGMVYFHDEAVTSSMLIKSYLNSLLKTPLYSNRIDTGRMLSIQKFCFNVIDPFFHEDALIDKCLIMVLKYPHVMPASKIALLSSLFTLLNKGIRKIIECTLNLSSEVLEIVFLCFS